MHWRRKGWTLIGMLLVAFPAAMRLMTTPVCAQASQIATTTVTNTLYRADGTLASGTVVVSWNAFTTSLGQSVPSGTTSATIGTNGVMTVSLVPNAGSTPMGSYYTAVYHLDDGTVSREFWVVPASSTPVQVSAIKTTVLPASVAMQTVSKSYVDTAIAAAVSGHPLDTTNPYVLKAGDTMTGPLALPGDPTTPTQAADKNYVDENVTALTTGLAQKVSTAPAGTQTVTQPTGTQLQVNRMNGAEYASQYVNGLGNNGIANATTSPDCANGCNVKVEPTYSSNENYTPSTWNSGSANGTHVEDDREGQRRDSYLNPVSNETVDEDAGQVIDVTSTRNTASHFAASGGNDPSSFGLVVKQEGLTGGSNDFPADIESVPYFKTNYAAVSVAGTYNTAGQHLLDSQAIDCYGIGDCLVGSQFVISSGGLRDEADEGTHPYDIQLHEDSHVFAGTCNSGCTTGSTSLSVTATSAPGTEGDGRYLIDKNPTFEITTGQILSGTGLTATQPAATATFSGTSFPVSVFLATGAIAQSQATNVAPGNVTLPIETTGVPAGFATSTAALPAQSGLACIAEPNSINPDEFEMASYTVVDGTHIQLTLQHPHRAGATIAIGGLCGYGLEQTVDTANGIRQVFPVIGSYSATGLYYAAGNTPVIGQMGQTGGFMNVSLSIASIARSNNVVTVTTAGNMPVDLNGLTLQVAGVSDSSYNGSFAVTTTGANTLTYANTGANSTSSGGTIGILTGNYVLYPMAEVLSVFNPATKKVDGQMTLAPNIVKWAANDPVEEPHYYQGQVMADTQFVGQTTPRPTVRASAGIQYQQNVSNVITGWSIENDAPASSYYGDGGSHMPPAIAYEATGVWRQTMSVQAGEQSVFSIHCNSHGCGKWNSNYNLFQLDSNAGVDTENYQPLTSTMNIDLRGTNYTFSPQAFTAGTINAGTINATTLNGTVSAAQLPVFGASGATHAPGAVPDPGATAGATRYLREDGTWDVPTGNVALAPQNIPDRTSLLGEYLLNEGTGAVAHDTSGQNNTATISGATWDGSADLNFGAQGDYIQLPTALNQANTFQFVIYEPPLGPGAAPFPPGYSFAQNPSLLCGTDTAHTCIIASSLFKPVSERFMAFNTSHTESREFLPSGWHVVTLVNGISPDVDHWYYDGAEVAGYVAQASGGIAHPATGNYQIGGSTAYSGTWFTGKIAAAWAWSTPLSATDVAAAAKAALDYARAKGAVHTYRAAASDTPTVIGGIDSRTFGFGTTKPWINNLTLTDGTYTSLDLGISGITATDTAAMFGSIYVPHIAPGSAPVIVALWGGINDMGSSAITTQMLADALHSMVSQAKAAGARVILATEISASGADTKKDALDAMIRSQAYSWGVDNLADLATIPQLGADGAYSNTTYFNADNLHPTDAGQTLIAGVMSNAVNELLGSTETSRHTTAAATYQEVAGDRFLDLTGTAAQAISLPDCIGYSLPREIVNLGAAASTVAPVNSETLTGSTALAVNTRAVFVPVPGAMSTGGCHWERTQ